MNSKTELKSNREILLETMDADVNTFHEWGDGWEYWSDLGKAIEEMGNYIRKSRTLVYDKEKFGTYRFDLLCVYDGTLKSILQPSVRVDFDWNPSMHWLYNHAPRVRKALKDTLVPVVNKMLKLFSRFDRLVAKAVPGRFVARVVRWQLSVLNEGFQKTCLKYPHIVNELVSDVDIYKEIKPYGNYVVDGEKIHNKYWREV